MTMVSPFLPILERDISDLEKPGAAGYGGACLLRGKTKTAELIGGFNPTKSSSVWDHCPQKCGWTLEFPKYFPMMSSTWILELEFSPYFPIIRISHHVETLKYLKWISPWCHHVSSWNISTLDAKFPNRNSDEVVPRNHPKKHRLSFVGSCAVWRLFLAVSSWKIFVMEDPVIWFMFKKGLTSPLFGARLPAPCQIAVQEIRQGSHCEEQGTEVAAPGVEQHHDGKNLWCSGRQHGPTFYGCASAVGGCFYGYNMI